MPTQELTIDRLIHAVDPFRAKIESAKAQVSASSVPWYPYDTLTNLWTLDRLLSGTDRDLATLIGNKPVLDIGCADGDLAFLLESEGIAVDVLDTPASNLNAMRGVYTLKERLRSKIGIHECDLDQGIGWPDKEYGLIVFLGVLYHLKNPIAVLEQIAKRCDYCMVSTKLTQYIPGVFENVSTTAMAYLADVYEWNQDSTNYWAFSDAGFRRVLARCNLDVRQYLLVNELPEDASTGAIGSQRAFCLCQSRFAQARFRLLLGSGWHPREEEGWRWASRKFSVRLEQTAFQFADALRWNIYLPEPFWKAAQPGYGLQAWINGRPAGSYRFEGPGSSSVRIDVKPFLQGSSDLRMEFHIENAGPVDSGDRRDLGVVISSAEVESRGQSYRVL